LLIDKNGHLKLTDFGLSTGFHHTHDSNFYQQFRTGSIDNIELIDIKKTGFDNIDTWKVSFY
jgi:protein-serine/threonine kinase